MNTKPLTMKPGTPTRDAARHMLKDRLPAIPIVEEDGRLVGVFSQQGLMICLVHVVNNELPPGTVDCHLDPDPPCVSEETGLLSIAQIFAGDARQRAIAVLHEEKLVGVVTRLHVIRAFMDYMAEVTDHHSRTLYLSALKDAEEAPPF
jgi:CBS domain-containing protein